VRVVATEAAATLPFGAVSHLLPGGRPPAITDFVTALRDGALGADPCLFVDDAHLLDDASAALLLTVANTGVAPVLLTIRSGERSPDALTALWKDRLLDRVDLQPLSAQEAELLVDRRRGGASHALVHDWIYRLSEGNPLYVSELVADAERSGRLEVRDGRWHLVEGHAPLERLGDLLASHIGSVSADARAALDVLALGAPMRLGALEALTVEGALEELERAQLAVVGEDGRGLVVEVAHPLYGEVVLSGLPSTAARRIRRDLAATLAHEGADSPAERVAIARLLLESGEVDEELFLEASATALHLGAAEVARSLAAVLPRSLAGALCLAQALEGTGRFGEAEDVLAPFEGEAAAAGMAVAAEFVMCRVRSLLRGPGDQPEQVSAVLARCASWHAEPDWRALLDTLAAWLEMNDQAWTKAAALVQPALADPEVGPERRRQLLMAYARALSRRGRADDYDTVVAEIDQLTERLDQPPMDSAFNGIRRQLAAITAARDLRGSRREVEAGLEEATRQGDPSTWLVHVYNLAHIEHIQGHHHEARALFQRAIDHLAVADAFNLAPITEVMLAITFAYLGDEKEARRALERTDASIARMPYLARAIAPDRARAEAMVEMAAGRARAARDRLLEVAATAGDDVLVATEALHVALLLGAEAGPCAAQLEAFAADAQDDLIHLWARHARAVADRDPAEQLAAAEAFEEHGLDLDAAQAAALAALAFRQAGSSDGANRASTLAATCAARCPGVQVPALAVRPDAPELTAREREIAGLAARGLSNPEIADALILSVRTVETYVLRVYRKLGVHNRAGLAKVLDTGTG
jgi:DNA-binding CsgD family transcriptional regulator